MDKAGRATKRKRRGERGKGENKGAKKKRGKKTEAKEEEEGEVDEGVSRAAPVTGYNPEAGDYGVTVQDGIAEWFVRQISASNRVPVQDRVDIVASRPRDRTIHVATLEELPTQSRTHITRMKPLRLKQREIYAKYKGPREKYLKIRRHHMSGAIHKLQAGNADVTMRPVTVNKKGYMTEIVSGTKSKKLTPKLLREKMPGWIAEYLREMLPDMLDAPFNETVFAEFDAPHMQNAGDLVKAKLEDMYAAGEMDDAFTDVRLAMM